MRGEGKKRSAPLLQDFNRYQNPLLEQPGLQRRPEAKLTEGVSIDDYSTWRAVRFADPDEIG